MPEAKQTVFVVDDDDALRDAIATFLHAEGQACETYADAASLLARLDEFPPEASGCLVLDVRMPGLSGLDVQDELNARGMNMPIIFITGYGDVPSAVRAMKGGAVDFISKPFDAETLAKHVRKALRTDVQRRTARRELAMVRSRAATLTPREREVLERVAAGQANKRVAMDLGVSERTVEIHRSHLMKKMGVRHLADLVRLKLLLDQA